MDTHLLYGNNGLINSYLGENNIISGFPDGFKMYVANSFNVDFLGCDINDIAATGTSIKKNVENVAIAEYIERYLSTKPRKDIIFKSSYNNLVSRNKVLDPSLYDNFTPEQYILFKNDKFKIEPFDSNSEIFWMEGKTINDELIYVPCYLVYWNHIDNDEKIFNIPNTTGLATGLNKKNAIESAFLESNERHSFSKFWYLQNYNKNTIYTKTKLIEIYGLDKDIYDLLNVDYRINTFDLSKYGYTNTALTILECELYGKKVFSIGSSSKFCFKDALKKSLLEVYQCLTLVKQMFETKQWNRNINEVLNTKMNNFDDNLFFFNFFPELKSKIPVFNELKNIKSNQKSEYNTKVSSFNKKELNNSGLKDTIIVDLQNDIIPSHPVFKVLNHNFIDLTSSFKYPVLNSPFFEGKELFTKYPHFFP